MEKNSNHQPVATVIPDRLIRLREVMSRTGLGRSSIYARMADSKFPAAVALGEGAHAVGWQESAVQNWIENLIAAGRKTAGAQRP